jgi:hypothetical protein
LTTRVDGVAPQVVTYPLVSPRQHLLKPAPGVAASHDIGYRREWQPVLDAVGECAGLLSGRIEAMEVRPGGEGPLELFVTKLPARLIVAVNRHPAAPQWSEPHLEFNTTAVPEPAFSFNDAYALPRGHEPLNGAPTLVPIEELLNRNWNLTLERNSWHRSGIARALAFALHDRTPSINERSRQVENPAPSRAYDL